MSIQTAEELSGLRRAGRAVAATLREVRRRVRPRVTTAELDRLAARTIARLGARPAPNLLYGFPGAICISVGDEAVHGIPGRRRLRSGELVKLDVTLELDGFYADAAISVPVGSPTPPEVWPERQTDLRRPCTPSPGLASAVLGHGLAAAPSGPRRRPRIWGTWTTNLSPAFPARPLARRLCAAADAALARALDVATAGSRLNEIGRAVEREVGARRFSVLGELCGHGIGRAIHEEPSVPNVFLPALGGRLTEGLVITVEPVVAAGRDGLRRVGRWTEATADGSLSAHVEHTIAITRGRPLVLTAG